MSYSFPVSETTTETPDWIAELVAATGRFEALCDHAIEWAEKFCEKSEK